MGLITCVFFRLIIIAKEIKKGGKKRQKQLFVLVQWLVSHMKFNDRGMDLEEIEIVHDASY
jgi:hemerythrin